MTTSQANQQPQQYIVIPKFSLSVDFQFAEQYRLHSSCCGCIMRLLLPPVRQVCAPTCLPNIHLVTAARLLHGYCSQLFLLYFFFLRLKCNDTSPLSFLPTNCPIHPTMLSLECMVSFSIICYWIHICVCKCM